MDENEALLSMIRIQGEPDIVEPDTALAEKDL